nr:hypothetical protein [Tanacetum cinerariifolium]
MAEKFNQEKEKNEKLKELKAWLNFDVCFGTLRYSESKTMNTKEHDKRYRSRHSYSLRTSVFSRIRRERSMSPIRRERSRSPRQRAKERGMCKRLGSRGKSVFARSDSYNQHSHSSHIKTYDGSEDPKDHLKIFQEAAKTERFAMPTWCYMFNLTLIGNVRVWFDDLPPESIDSYDDLKKVFMENYLQRNKYKLESRDVKGARECMRIFGFVHGITNPELIKRLHDKILKTMDEMMIVTTSFLQGEVAASNHERKKSFPPWNQHEGNQKQNFKKEVSGANKDKGKFKAPPPMTTPVENRNHAKFCEFHGEVGHNMDECMHLRKQIEEMLKAGKLSHLIKEIKQNNGKEQPKVRKKGETSRKDKALAILMVQPWEIVARQRITQSFFLNPEIFFPPLEEDEGTEGPMIIEAKIGCHCVHHMYVDGRSASEIIGKIIWPIGKIQLLAKIRDEEHSALAWMNFMAVRSQSSYNGIIGRPGVRKLQAVLSTSHEMLKIVRPKTYLETSSKRAGGIFSEKSLPFFRTLKKCTKKSDFHWTTKAKEAFKKIKQLIAELPMLMVPVEKEELIIYLAAAKETVSAVLMMEREAKHMPIYFVSRALRGSELNYASMEKLVLALVHASKCLKRPRVSVKGHILADFIVERPEEDSPDTPMEEEGELPEPWILFMDGSSCTDEADMIRYLEKVKALTGSFKAFSIKQIPRSENKKADALSKIASTSIAHLSKQVLVEELKEKSISEVEILVVVEEEGDTWMTPLFKYLMKGTLLADVKKARAIKQKFWRFKILEEIISDNGKQFWDGPFKDWCEKLCIRQHFASVKHPQTNGLVERENHSLGQGIKARLDARSKNWIEELPRVLWAHRTMMKSSNEETPFSLTYGTEAVIPTEIGMPTIRTAKVDLVGNNEALEINLDLLEERREEAAIREAKSKAKMENTIT